MEPHDRLLQVGINTVIEKIKALSQVSMLYTSYDVFEFSNKDFEFEIPYSENKGHL
jgi:hypothetical protein